MLVIVERKQGIKWMNQEIIQMFLVELQFVKDIQYQDVSVHQYSYHQYSYQELNLTH